jgi:UDP-2,4-diacetamido-2,4,6-trideoxy-beta-L-altropyranose hydrolase
MHKGLIVTEAGKKSGLGHVQRCLSIVQAFEEKSILIEMIVVGDSSIKQLKINSIITILNNWKNAIATIKKISPDLQFLIIDSYKITSKQLEELKTLNIEICILDDNQRLDYINSVIINGTVDAEKFTYDNSNDLLLGSKYIPLRKAFWKRSENLTAMQIEKILITFGGSDTRGLSVQISNWVALNYPNTTVSVLATNAFETTQLKALKDNKNIELILNPNDEAIKKAMKNADIAVSAGGQTLYELACLGIPAVAIKVIENQSNNIKGWEDFGFIKNVGNWNDKQLLTNLKNCIDEMESSEVRKQQAMIGKKHVDGQGARRIVKHILKNENIILN